MTRWILTTLLLGSLLAWVWLAHGLLWDVEQASVRVGSTPWSGAEPLAFARTRGDVTPLSFIDVQTPRQLARGISTRAVDVVLADAASLVAGSFGGTDVTLVGVLLAGDSGRAVLARRDDPRAARVFSDTWPRQHAAVLAEPERFRAHLEARRLPPADLRDARFVPASDRSRVTAWLRAEIGAASDDPAIVRLMGALQ